MLGVDHPLTMLLLELDGELMMFMASTLSSETHGVTGGEIKATSRSPWTTLPIMDMGSAASISMRRLLMSNEKF